MLRNRTRQICVMLSYQEKKYSWREGIWNNYTNYLRNLLQGDSKYTQIAANRENVPP